MNNVFRSIPCRIPVPAPRLPPRMMSTAAPFLLRKATEDGSGEKMAAEAFFPSGCLPMTEVEISDEELYEYTRYRWLYDQTLPQMITKTQRGLGPMRMRNLPYAIGDLTSTHSWMLQLRPLARELPLVRRIFS